MHPSLHARTSPDKPAYIMAASGTVVTYAQLEERIRSSLRRFFRKVLERDPIIIPLIARV